MGTIIDNTELLKVRSQLEFYKRLEIGEQYQDFITDTFKDKFGIAISTYSSYKYQKEKGENVQGFEVKYDKAFRERGNLFIEIQEDNHEAGILKKDNTLFYIQGDYKTIYWLTLIDLREEYESGKYKIAVSKHGCKGMLYPVERATKRAIAVIDL